MQYGRILERRPCSFESSARASRVSIRSSISSLSASDFSIDEDSAIVVAAERTLKL